MILAQCALFKYYSNECSNIKLSFKQRFALPTHAKMVEVATSQLRGAAVEKAVGVTSAKEVRIIAGYGQYRT